MNAAIRHLALAELDAGLRALPAPPRERGSLRLIVRRLADGSRDTPASVVLSREQGVPGDDWIRRPPRKPGAQLAIMRADVATLIAAGQPLTTFGDNLFVDLDLCGASLPAGSRLRIGRAVIEVTPEPHDGCAKFDARFGNDALRFVQRKTTRDQNHRGVYGRVIEDGEVAVGDSIDLLDPERAR